MFTVIVWASDGSPSAEAALPVARGLAERCRARLILAHVEEAGIGLGGAIAAGEEDGPRAHRAVLERRVDELRRDGIDAELRMATVPVTGVAHEIVELAKEEHADLLVVGTRGHSPVVGLLVGGVTVRLLSLSPCPVLAVPSQGT
jgi:nucleotide-binding universal stress UspA family protein